jgi:hypothetical protein
MALHALKQAYILSWTRPRSYWDVVCVHLPLALVAGIPLLLSFLAPLGLSPLKSCTLMKLTGYPCPFCGFTRSFSAIAYADWAFAVQSCPLACLVYVVATIAFVWNVTALLLGVRLARGRLLRLAPPLTRWLIILCGILLLLNWTYRISLGLS